MINSSNLVNNFQNINDNTEKILKQLSEFIDFIFEGIKSFDEKRYVYENNILRTINNIIYNNQKDYVVPLQVISLYSQIKEHILAII